jgi:hypothetical protein
MVCVAAACLSAGASISLSQVLEPLVTPEAIFSAFPGGLLMLGDSITRSLFKRITCILDDLDETDCAERGSDYKNQRCEHGTCHWFANRTDGFILEFDWLLSFGGRESPQTLQNGIRFSKAASLYIGLPGLHEVWIPGGRELEVTRQDDTFNLLTAIEGRLSVVAGDGRQTVVGTATPVCLFGADGNGEMAAEGRLLAMYLDGAELEGEKHSKEIKAYNLQLTETNTERMPKWQKARLLAHRHQALGPSYHGPIVPIRKCCTNHRCDNETFNNNGIANFNAVALRAVARFPTLRVADAWKATIGHECSGTTDGRHFNKYGEMKLLATVIDTFSVTTA